MNRPLAHAAPIAVAIASFVTLRALAQAPETAPPANPFAQGRAASTTPRAERPVNDASRAVAVTRTSSDASRAARSAERPVEVARTSAPPTDDAPSTNDRVANDRVTNDRVANDRIATALATAEPERADAQPSIVEVAPAPAPTIASDRPIEALAAAATHAEPISPPPDEAMGALDDVLAGDARDPIAGVEPAPAPTEPIGIPSRAETAAAIADVTPSMRACARDQAGEVVELRIVFTSNGRVTVATVSADGAHLSPQQRSCVARAARRAHVAAFARPRFEVRYPIRL